MYLYRGSGRRKQPPPRWRPAADDRTVEWVEGAVKHGAEGVHERRRQSVSGGEDRPSGPRSVRTSFRRAVVLRSRRVLCAFTVFRFFFYCIVIRIIIFFFFPRLRTDIGSEPCTRLPEPHGHVRLG